ncbi:MAG: hypothetical protein LAO77_14335 [Acidobacteriia bacterium]|nr:hypothetical protein [Terriglobia bacterium]
MFVAIISYWGQAGRPLRVALWPFGSSSAATQNAELDGWVYEKCEGGQLAHPLSGVVVSTSLDATTAVTDSDGHFRLVTHTRAFSSDQVIVTFRWGNTVRTHSINGGALTPGVHSRWAQSFTLSPPWRFPDELWPNCE